MKVSFEKKKSTTQSMQIPAHPLTQHQLPDLSKSSTASRTSQLHPSASHTFATASVEPFAQPTSFSTSDTPPFAPRTPPPALLR